jgi:hypothetical protein
VEDVICVTKAYSSCVGSKTEPFVSEVTGEAGDELRPGAETRANLVPPQAVPAGWAGSMPWPPSTAAWCRVPPKWR